MEKQPKYQNYRVCYDNGNPATGERLYELNKWCTCPGCKRRHEGYRDPRNRATVTTNDIKKVDDAADFLAKWTCADGDRILEPAHHRM